jgi:uncharacterized protein
MTTSNQILEKLTTSIESKGSALVALSGGIDSTLLSYLSHRALGKRARSCTVISEFFITDERRYIDVFVERFEISHSYIELRVLEDELVVSNPQKRCYYCKKAIFEMLLQKARREGFSAVFDGTNLDDLDEDRPGIKALHELGVVSPFIETGVGKEEILRWARSLGLEHFIRPSNTCLATRVSPSLRINEEILEMIEKAERYLHRLGFSVVRVRYHEGGTARIEVASEELHRLLDTSLHRDMVQYLKRVGFRRVAVDLEGYKKQKGPPGGGPLYLF